MLAVLAAVVTATTSPPEKTAAELQALLEAYNPEIWQHPDGLFFPVDVEAMMKDTAYTPLIGRECIDGQVRLMYSTNDTSMLKGTPDSGRVLAVAGRIADGYSLTYFLYYHYNKATRLVDTFDNYGDWENIQIMLEWQSSDGTWYLSPVSSRTESHGNGWLLNWNDPKLLLTSGSGTNELGESIRRPQVFASRDSHGNFPNPALVLSRFYPTDAKQQNRMCSESGLDRSDVNDMIARLLCDYVAGPANGGIPTTFPIGTLRVTTTSDVNGSISFTYLATGEDVHYLAEEGELCPPDEQGTPYQKHGPAYRWGNPVNAQGHAQNGPTNPRHKPWIWDSLIVAPLTPAPEVSAAQAKSLLLYASLAVVIILVTG